MFNYTGISHLAIVTPDMDRTIEFWRDLLGMPLVGGIGKGDYKQYFFKISPGLYLSFLTWKDARAAEEKEPGSPKPGYSGLDHLCITVEDEDDLYRVKARLEAADIWVSEVIDHGFVHSIFTFDPNGIALEIGYPVRGKDLGDAFRMKDPEPTIRAKEGPEPNPDRWPEPGGPDEQRRLYRGQLLELFED